MEHPDRTKAVRLLGVSLVMVVVVAVWPGQGQTACRWSWDCTDGRCAQIPLCDAPHEIPPIQPLENPPVPLPSLKPIQPHVFPPPGKRTCREAYICDRNSQCRWKSVCE